MTSQAGAERPDNSAELPWHLAFVKPGVSARQALAEAPRLRATSNTRDHLPSQGFASAVLLGPSCHELIATDRIDLAIASSVASADLMLLLLPMDPPMVNGRVDGDVDSAVVSAPLLRALLDRSPEICLEALVFELLNLAMSGGWPGPRLLVRELLARQRPEVALPPDDQQPVCVIPHRGPGWHLECCLAALQPQGVTPSLAVGFDGPAPDSIDALKASYPEVRFESFLPAGVGPFLIRETLLLDSQLLDSHRDNVMFQDSDDVATLDRVASLHDAMQRHEADLVGSHFIELDEIDRRVKPVRFPLDVLDALCRAPMHAQLHGTTLARRQAFIDCGGYSTQRPFANDSQFLLRAAFSLTITNTDAFLYIRRRHASALTEVIPLSAESREDLDLQWKNAFIDVARQQTTVEASALNAIKRDAPFSRRHL